MMIATITAAMLAAGNWLDTRVIGEATLIGVAAVAIGYLVSKIWPKSANPQLFGSLAAFLLVGGMAYLGSTGAGIALIVLIIVAVVLGIAALAL